MGVARGVRIVLAARRERPAQHLDRRGYGLERIVGLDEELEVAFCGHVGSVQAELREPEPVQVWLIADHEVLEEREAPGDRSGIRGEVGALLRGHGRRPAARVHHLEDDAHPAQAGSLLDDRELLGLGRGGAPEPGRPDRGQPHRGQARELEQRQLRPGLAHGRLANAVLRGADEHRGPACSRRGSEGQRCGRDQEESKHDPSRRYPLARLASVKNALAKRLETLPARPGVYLFRGSDGGVLYVGKAKSLRPRVRSYFQRAGGGGRASMAQLTERIADVEVIVTGTEVEALHLEQNLIKRHRPP
ncbi:MAG: nucleotide excision repair endonuclease, partial [Actinobacteria bacterium]|nr:nucleotide excision repair endonuclease [Actinomycetota bacterium]